MQVEDGGAKLSSLEEARRDPLIGELDKELFPLRGRINKLSCNASIFVSIQQLRDLIQRFGLNITVDFDAEDKRPFSYRFMKASDVSAAAAESNQQSEVKGFAVSINLNILPYTGSEFLKAAGDAFKIRILNHSTGKMFEGEVSKTKQISVYSLGEAWILSDFTEVDAEGNVIAEHEKLTFPNTPEVTQNRGITFESVKLQNQRPEQKGKKVGIVDFDPPLHQQS